MDDYGRSPNINKTILNCINSGVVKSISIMVGMSDNKYYRIVKKKKLIKKLHLNLTDRPKCYNVESKELMNNMSLFKLLFVTKKEKEIIKLEIESQIIEFVKNFGEKNLKIDGHEHVQMIPWIYNFLINYKKHKISEIRYSIEKLTLFEKNFLFTKQFLRNFIGIIFLKFLTFFFKKKFKSSFFFGLLYSNMYNKNILLKNIKFIKKNKLYFKNYKYVEILIHGGHCIKKEKKLFTQKYFNYFYNRQRLIEYKLGKNNFFKL